MSPPVDPVSPDERMKRLERKAQVIRERLLHAVDALDTRRHQVAAMGSYAKRMAKPAALSAIGIAAVVGLSALGLVLALRARRKRSLKARVSHALQGLELVPRPPTAMRIFEKVAVAMLTFAATDLAKRASKNFVDGRLPDGRLMVGSALRQSRERLAGGGAS
jgi:diacylglycerol kinase